MAREGAEGELNERCKSKRRPEGRAVMKVNRKQKGETKQRLTVAKSEK